MSVYGVLDIEIEVTSEKTANEIALIMIKHGYAPVVGRSYRFSVMGGYYLSDHWFVKYSNEFTYSNHVYEAIENMCKEIREKYGDLIYSANAVFFRLSELHESNIYRYSCF